MSYFEEVSREEYLAHHGILGQKWGIRRYQNLDGTLTDMGRKRQNRKENPEQYKSDKAELRSKRRDVAASGKTLAKRAKIASSSEDRMEKAMENYSKAWTVGKLDAAKINSMQKSYDDEKVRSSVVGQELARAEKNYNSKVEDYVNFNSMMKEKYGTSFNTTREKSIKVGEKEVAKVMNTGINLATVSKSYRDSLALNIDYEDRYNRRKRSLSNDDHY